MKTLHFKILAFAFLAHNLVACGMAKTAGKVAIAPVKGVYHAGRYTGKAVMWTGKGFVKTGETMVNVTNAALDTTSRALLVTSQLINVSGQIVTVSSQISRAELEATLKAARESKDIISILVDVVK